MTTEREALLQRMSRAAYAFVTTRSDANWENKRPGLRFEGLHGVRAESCGAFRAWEILAAKGKVGWCVDGYRQRSTKEETGAVYVLIGEEGEFVFPYDDSRSDHSLQFKATKSAKLVNVTDEPSVKWEPIIEEMAAELEAATERIQAAVAAYDEAKRREKELARSAEVVAASQALAAT